MIPPMRPSVASPQGAPRPWGGPAGAGDPAMKDTATDTAGMGYLQSVPRRVVTVWLPLSAWSVYAFAIALGLLWLSTVPPTNGIVAQVFGVRYLAMLAGFTFLSHQVGSFLGAWLGGRLYDTLGSYDIVWYLSIALGVAAGLLNLPVDEREIRRHGHARA